jgi:hypothetical protein
VEAGMTGLEARDLIASAQGLAFLVASRLEEA